MIFVPADRPDRFSKALASGADAVIVDLEDAVAVSAKATAREGLAGAVPPAAERPVPLLVRINDALTPWWRDDLDSAAAAGADGLMLPKAGDAETVRAVVREARARGLPAPIPILETAAGLGAAREIMAAAGMRANFGAGDLGRDLGLSPARDEAELAPYRAMVVLAARLAGVGAPLDTVWADLADKDGLAASAARAARMGFCGKLCIHPRQVGPINDAFTPDAAALAAARRAVDAFEAAEADGRGSIEVDGAFVDYPVAARARAVLARARD